MDLKFIGIGGAFNPMYGCNSSYVKKNNKILFLDYGMDTFSKTLEHKLLDNVEDIYVFISHLHGDHVGGLPTFIQYCSIVLKKKVKVIHNSDTFTNSLVKLLNITGISTSDYSIVDKNELNGFADLCLIPTTHAENLECFSVILKDLEDKIFYSADTNDLKQFISIIKDRSFTKIYYEIGENSPFHIDFKDVSAYKDDRLYLMHFPNQTLLDKVRCNGFKIPDFLR